MFAYEHTNHISQRMDSYGTNNHMNTTSDNHHQYDDCVEEESGGVEEQQVASSVQEYWGDDNNNNDNNNYYNFEPNFDGASATEATHTKAFRHHTIVDANDLMMISVSQQQHLRSSKNKIAHRYVLTDDEVEQSLQELDDTVASLDGGDSVKHHRRTHTANSSAGRSSIPSGHGTVTTTGVDETSSLTSCKSSVQTEKSYAVLMHRHLIDNMETICYSNSNFHRTSSSYKRTNNTISSKQKCPSTTSIPCGSKSISSRNSSTSRRSKMSTTQQSYTSHRTSRGSRRPRGPSLERVIFQTLLYTARSDVADTHFNNVPKKSLVENDGNYDFDSHEDRDDTVAHQKEDDDLCTQLILKDLIQVDAILSVEVGSTRCLDRNNEASVAAADDRNHVLGIGTSDRSVITILDETSSNNNLLLLPPVSTEEEPESFLPIATTTTTYISCNNKIEPRQHFLPLQSPMDELEWEPDFDAIVFPTTSFTTVGNIQKYDKESSIYTTTDNTTISQQQQQQSEFPLVSTTTTVTPSTVTSRSPHHEQPHSSNEDSPESDIFDHIDDDYDDDGYNYIDEGTASDFLNDEYDNDHLLSATARRKLNRGNDPPEGDFTSTILPATHVVTQPKVKVYDTVATKGNTVYYETGSINDAAMSRGLDNTQPESHATGSTVATPITNSKNVSDHESIHFPTVLQEADDKTEINTITADITHIQKTSLNINDDEWTSFEINTFASNKVRVESPLLQQNQQNCTTPERTVNANNDDDDNNNNDSGHQHFNDILNVNAASQDNVSVSSPASVVQLFLQIVDRCPSNKSDNNTPPSGGAFDTKCSF